MQESAEKLKEELATAPTETPTLRPKKESVMIFTKEVRKAFGIRLTPYKRVMPKIGRNTKCPCGSGLKYKHCCIDTNNIKI